MRQVYVFEAGPRQREPEPHITLVRRDDGNAIILDAVALLAQYELSQGDVLLILDEDCPYEEQLHLVLVRGSRVLDHIVIGAPYVAGIYREVGIEGDALRFRFESDAVWTVGAQDKATYGLGGLPSGARRRWGWLASHHLLLSREQGE